MIWLIYGFHNEGFISRIWTSPLLYQGFIHLPHFLGAVLVAALVVK